MTNNFRAAKQTTTELEALINALPVKTPSAKQAIYMANKHTCCVMDWLSLAEKREKEQL